MNAAVKAERLVVALLGARDEFAVGRARLPLGAFALAVGASGFVYGAFMGSYSLRPLQMLISGLKVPMLLAVTTAVCIPSFIVINMVIGLRDDLTAALRGVLAAQGTVAIVLASLAPTILVAYGSTTSYRFALNINGLPFAIAAFAGHRTLALHYRPLIARNRRHAVARALWLVLYVFVAIQLAWVLRPFVGDPNLGTAFLRPNAWSNAYIEVLHDLGKLARGR